jgi:hypothetical protein
LPGGFPLSRGLLASDQPFDVVRPEAVPALSAEANRRKAAGSDELSDSAGIDTENLSDLFRAEQPRLCDGGHAFLLVFVQRFVVRLLATRKRRFSRVLFDAREAKEAANCGHWFAGARELGA